MKLIQLKLVLKLLVKQKPEAKPEHTVPPGTATVAICVVLLISVRSVKTLLTNGVRKFSQDVNSAKSSFELLLVSVKSIRAMSAEPSLIQRVAAEAELAANILPTATAAAKTFNFILRIPFDVLQISDCPHDDEIWRN